MQTAYRTNLKDAYYYPESAWQVGFIGGYKFQVEPGVLDLSSYDRLFFYATGVTPAMEEKMVVGSQYAFAAADADGNPFDGGRNYRLHLPPHIPVKVIIYDNQTRSMLQTDQRYPSVSSQTKGLVANDDGSVDVYFGPQGAPVNESSRVTPTNLPLST